jgi:hypothetical protein
MYVYVGGGPAAGRPGPAGLHAQVYTSINRFCVELFIYICVYSGGMLACVGKYLFGSSSLCAFSNVLFQDKH